MPDDVTQAQDPAPSSAPAPNSSSPLRQDTNTAPDYGPVAEATAPQPDTPLADALTADTLPADTLAVSTPPAPVKDSATIGEYVFAALTAILGLVMTAGSFTIPVPHSADPLGPRTVPLAVGVLLIVVSLWILIQLRRGIRGQAEDSEDIDLGAHTDWRTVAALVALVAVHAALIEPLGWPIAAAVLFTGAGIALGARPWWKTLVIAVVLAFVLQFVFAFLLGVSLPAGLLERVVFLHG